MVELVVRLVFSLAVIVGMLMLLTRFSAKKFRGGTGALVRVVHRQPLSRTSAVAVVTVGSRVLVVGTTEQQVHLLTELDPEEIELPESAVDSVDPVDAVALELVAAPYEPRHAAASPLLPSAPVSAPAPVSVAALRAARSARVSDGALAGSVLSAQTWKQALAAATNRTRDAS